MKVNEHMLLERCIEDGLRDGWRRAHKHVEQPTEVGMTESMWDAIWLHIDEYFNFETTND